MVDREAVKSKILDIVGPFSRDQEALRAATGESRLLEDLKINSARLVDIVLEMEDAFRIEIGDDDADRVRTVGDAVEVVAGKMAA